MAASAILAMLADTMIPEAFESAHKLAGLVTVLGFLTAFFVSRLSHTGHRSLPAGRRRSRRASVQAGWYTCTVTREELVAGPSSSVPNLAGLLDSALAQRA